MNIVKDQFRSIDTIIPAESGSRRLEDISALDLPKVVEKPADDNFIKSIVREYLSIKDIGQESPMLDDSDILYAHLRVDPDSIAPINIEAKRELFLKARKDYYTNHSEKPDIIPLHRQYGWYTFQSWELSAGEKISDSKIAHKFYINSKDPMKFCNVLYDTYKKHNIPFYFKTPGKWDEGKGYKDSIVIYTSTELLEKNLEVLGDIEKNHLEIIEECNQPHEFVGEINKWLGYSTEMEDAVHSYISIISIAFAKAIEKSVKDFAKNNPDVLVGNTKMSDYYSGHMTLDERRSRTQNLMCHANKIDSNFVEKFCVRVRDEMRQLGINPGNICFDDTRKQEIDLYYGKNE